MIEQAFGNVRRVPSTGTSKKFHALGLDPPIRPQPNLCVPEETREFEIGLVLAGAISAGAYIAGVLDFFVEALDVWENAKVSERANNTDPRTWSVPGHDVVIPVISGASGGGVNAAIFSSNIWRDFTHVRQDNAMQSVDNPFFNTWVEGIDATDLMSVDDLSESDSLLLSILNSTKFEKLALASIESPPRASSVSRGYLGDPLRILITTTNLRGVPYWMRVQGNAPQGHGLTLHQDYVGFACRGLRGNQEPGRSGKIYENEIELTYPPQSANEAWYQLSRVALATSAFPMVFQSRHLKRSYSDYDYRCIAEAPGTHEQYFAVLPSTQDEEYEYLNVDGGAMNNEPLELARGILAGRHGRNPRGGKQAMRATLLVDPFPEMSDTGPTSEQGSNPVSTALALFNSWINQARFKPEDLALAHDEDVYSRFLIAPLRSGPAGQQSCGYSLASSVLGGFGGFLCREYRVHDYLLGRRNCQQFLRHHFVLSAEHPMFMHHWNGNLTVPHEQGGYGVFRGVQGGEEGKQLHLPIIPLVKGSVVEDNELVPEWPRQSYQEGKLSVLVEKRFDALWFATLEGLGVGWTGQTYLGPARRKIRERVATEVARRLTKDLKKRGLRE